MARSSTGMTGLAGPLMARLLGIALALAAAGAFADQNDPELDRLFDELATADAAPQANRLEGRIWQRWLQAPTPESRSLVERIEWTMRSGRLDAALAASNRLVAVVPDYAEGWNKRATVRYLMEDFGGSIQDIRSTLRLEPRHFGAISGLGLIYLRRGDKVAALAAIEHVLEISPSSANAQANVERVKQELESGV